MARKRQRPRVWKALPAQCEWCGRRVLWFIRVGSGLQQEIAGADNFRLAGAGAISEVSLSMVLLLPA